MKRKNTLWSLVLALVMVLGVFAPLSALASSTETSEDPKEIEVVVHKILMDEFGDHDVNKEYDPAKGIAKQEIGTWFGHNAKEIGDVAFVAIKKGEKGYDNFQQLTKEEQGKIYDDAADGYKGKTTADGFPLKLASPGEYNIYEVKSRSTYVGVEGENKDKILAEQLAVPVKLKLPDHARTASGTVNKIHVYPKNTEDKPEVNKYVVKNKKDVDKASFDMTKEHTWAIEAKIPTGFKDYQRFELVDTLDKALSYVKGQADAGTITVKVGTKPNDVFTEETSAEAKLIKGTDYTIIEPTETKGGTFKVALTNAGIQKLAKLETDKGDAKNQAGFEGKLLRVEFKSTINEDAIMGKPIPNNVELKYGHTPDANGSTKPKNPPTVETGGKRFLKYDSDNETRKLAGAKFVVKNANDEYLFEDKNGNYVWEKVDNATPEKLKKLTKDGKEASTPEPDKYLKVLTSGADGAFEIKGLEYGIVKSGDKYVAEGRDYWLREIEAPVVDGIKYALKDGEIKFTVDDKSYYKDPSKIELGTTAGDADPLKIDNKKITIPQTGGMGTMIFMVAGLALMGGAFIAMRKRSAEQA